LSMTLQTSPQPPPQFTILTFFIILIWGFTLIYRF
jgi:hypothetical protein